MSDPPRIEPGSVQSLRGRINNVAGGDSTDARRIALLVADTVIGQVMPPGVLKGGGSLQIRLGEDRTRPTKDLDAARRGEISIDDWIEALSDQLRSGWGGFTGIIDPRPSKPPPDDVPDDYVMRRFRVTLSYKTREWSTLPLELSRDEVGSTADPDFEISARALELFRRLGLPDPDPVPHLPVAHQIAQKLHACTGVDSNGDNDRAHDLVDLQLLVNEYKPDPAEIRAVAIRLFASRRRQAWPPQVVEHSLWEARYVAESAGLAVLPTVAEAIDWTNELIALIETSTAMTTTTDGVPRTSPAPATL